MVVTVVVQLVSTLALIDVLATQTVRDASIPGVRGAPRCRPPVDAPTRSITTG